MTPMLRYVRSEAYALPNLSGNLYVLLVDELAVFEWSAIATLVDN
jgi:hypothetical protein